MAITYVSSGAAVYSTGNPSPTTPTHNVGDMLILAVGTKPDTTPATTPSGWTSLGVAAGGTGSQGIDTGPMRVGLFYRIADNSALDTTGAITITGNNVSAAQVHVFRMTGDAWDISGIGAADTTTGTPHSVTMPSNPGLTVGDMLFTVGVIPTDVGGGTQFSAETVAASGMTTVNLTEIGEWSTSSGQDMGGWSAQGLVVTGTATGNPTVSATAGGTTTNVAGPIYLVRMRELVTTLKSASETIAITATDAGLAESSANISASDSSQVKVTESASRVIVGQENRLTNPSFESGIADWRVSTNIGGATVTLEHVAVAGAADGNYVLRATITGGNGTNTIRIQGPRVPVNSTIYSHIYGNLSFRTTSGSHSDIGAGARLFAENSNNAPFGSTYNSASSSWRKGNAVAQSSSGHIAAAPEIVILNSPSGTVVEIDAAQINEMNSTTLPAYDPVVAPTTEKSASDSASLSVSDVATAPVINEIELKYFSDDFNRATLDGNWTAANTNGIIVDNAYGVTGTVHHQFWTTPTNTDNQFSEVTVVDGTSLYVAVTIAGAGLTNTTNDSHYRFMRHTSNIGKLFIKPAGGTAQTELATSGVAINAGDVITMEKVDGVIKCYINGTAVISYTPTGANILTGKYVGMAVVSGTVTNIPLLDNWKGGDYGSSPPSTGESKTASDTGSIASLDDTPVLVKAAPQAYNNTFNAGTQGVEITTTNSTASGDTFDGASGAGGSAIYDSAAAIRGAMGATITAGASATRVLRWAINQVPEASLQFYFKYTGAPTGTVTLARFVSADFGDSPAHIAMDSSGQLVINTNSVSRYTTASLTTGTNYRIQLQARVGNTLGTGRVFFRLYDDSDVLVDSYSSDSTNTGTIYPSYVQYGKISSAPSMPSFYMDELAYLGTYDQIAPVASTAAEVKAGSDTGSISVADTSSFFREIAASDTGAVAVTDTSATTKQIPVSDTSALSISEATNVGSTLPGSETTALGVTDTSATLVTRATTDTSAIQVTEGTTQFGESTRNDTTAVTITETATIFVTNQTSEINSLTITETVVTQKPIVASDTASITVTDAGTNAGDAPSQETIMVSVAEETAILVSRTVTDTLPAMLFDSSETQVSRAGTDSASITVADTVNLAADKSASDTSSVGVSELTDKSATDTVSDSSSISVTETVAITKSFTGSDTGAITITEAQSNSSTGAVADSTAISVSDTSTAHKSLGGADTSAITVTETRTIEVTRSTTDSFSIAVSETTAVLKTIIATDGAGIAAEDAYILDKPITASDTSALAVTDTVFSGNDVPASDTTSLAVSETIAFTKGLVGEDVFSITVGEFSTIAVTSDAADTSTLSVSEEVFGFAIVAASDSLSISVTDESLGEGGAEESATDTLDLTVIDQAVVNYVELIADDTIDMFVNEVVGKEAELPSLENVSVGVTDVSEVLVMSGDTDEFVVGMSDDIETAVLVSTNDEPSLSITENFSRYREIDVTDNLALEVVERQEFQTTGENVMTDMANLKVVETTSMHKNIQVEDTVALAVTEGSHTARTDVVSDTGTIGAEDSSAVFVSVFASELNGLRTSETTEFNRAIDSADAAAVQIQETAQVISSSNLESHDSTGIQVLDASFTTAVFEASDESDVSVTEESVEEVKVGANDSSNIRVDESTEFYRDLDASDSVSVILEDEAESYMELTAEDTVAVSVNDASEPYQRVAEVWAYYQGEWRQGTPYAYKNGQWEEIHIYTYSEGEWVTHP